MPTPLPATPTAPAPRAQALVNGQNVGPVNAQLAGTDPNAGLTHLAGAFAPTGTMTANISSPNSTTTNPAPAVTTSSAAATDLANKQTQVNQLNTDTANHTAIVAGANQPVTTGSTSSTPDSSTSTTTPTTGTSSLDDQINDILTSFGTQESSINDTANTQEAALNTEATQAQTDLDTQATAALSKLDSISSGTYPLSPAEQQVMSATQAGFTAAIQLQTTANASYTGQMTEAMASLGINTSAPTQALGMIYAAVSTGASKIADLNSQMAVSLGNLQLGFQKEDFSEVQSAWEETSSYMENRIKTLTDMQTSVATAAKNQVDELQAYTTSAIDAYTKSATFDFNVADAAIKNGLAQGTLDEKTANDLSDRALQAQSNAIAQENANTNAEKAQQGSATEQKDTALSSIDTLLQPNAKGESYSTPSGQPYIIKNSSGDWYLTKDGFDTLAQEGASDGLTKDDIISEYSQYFDPSALSGYGISAADGTKYGITQASS